MAWRTTQTVLTVLAPARHEEEKGAKGGRERKRAPVEKHCNGEQREGFRVSGLGFRVSGLHSKG